MAWIAARLYFAGLFSYRIPNLSPSYALSSPVPSPAALRLALVETAIRSRGSVGFGEEIFNLVKAVPIEVEPPQKISVMKFFIKRLKPSKSTAKGCEESFGIREYCHFIGPVRVFMHLSKSEEVILNIFRQLRRLGTTDSILFCSAELQEEAPDLNLTWKSIESVKPDISNFQRRPVVTLNELDKKADFSQVNPYSKKRRGQLFVSQTYLLPLQEIKKGMNFVLYEKVPFI